MQVTSVPAALRDRLGYEATSDLIDLLEISNLEWRDRVLSVVTERFERRLTQEISALRLEFHDGLAALRGEMATTRVELLKWSFLFWVGQVAAIAGLLAFMLRSVGR